MDSIAPVCASQSAAVSSANRVSFSQSQTADVTILTAEGDKVTLSASMSSETEFSTYNSNGSTSASISRQTEQSASFQVEGDLNAEELKDIRKALRTLQKVRNDLLHGHPDKAAERTAKLQNLDTIAQFDADIEVTREISIEQSIAPVDSAPAESEAAAPTTTPATSDSVQPATTQIAPAQNDAPKDSALVRPAAHRTLQFMLLNPFLNPAGNIFSQLFAMAPKPSSVAESVPAPATASV